MTVYEAILFAIVLPTAFEVMRMSRVLTVVARWVYARNEEDSHENRPMTPQF